MPSDFKKIQESVLAAVRDGKIVMRPRSHFLLLTALAVVGVLLLVLVLLFLASFTFFSVRHTGLAFLPAFGPSGWFLLLRSMPWLLIVLSLAFVGILEALVRHFAFAYKKPLLLSLLGILLLVLVGGGLLAQTSLHHRVYLSVRGGSVPVAGAVYRRFGAMHPQDVHIGTITDHVDGGFEMQGDEGTTLVLVTQETRFPAGTDFEEGDRILVFGAPVLTGVTTTIHALGVREVNDEFEGDLPMFSRSAGMMRFRMMPATP